MAYAPPTTYDPTNVMGRRIVAWFIDVFIPLVIAFAVGWAIFSGKATKHVSVPSDYCSTVRIEQTGMSCIMVGNDAYVATSADARHAVAVGGLIYLIGAANLFLLQGLTGAALGKQILGLRVVRADGSIAGFGWNALRTLLLVVDQFFCALPGLISASVTHPHRRIGDFAAGTFVVARESVGRPIGAPMSAGAYPPPWNAPGGGWGPPPGGQTWGGPTPTPGWGAPNPAPTQTWGPPPAQGAPAAAPPATQVPGTWGAPAPAPAEPQPQPQPQPQAQPVAEPASEPTAAATQPTAATDAPGWASPTPAAEPQQQPQPQPAAAAPPPSREPQWDAQRNAWVFWEAETNRWLQHDPASNTWGPLR